MKNLKDRLNSLPSVIGIIDSGIGGISVLNALAYKGIKQVMYVADTAYLPYGQQPYEVLLQRGIYITDFLLAHSINTIVVACHTASATILPALQELYPHVVFIDLLVPTVVHATQVTRNKKIGVLATSNTVASGRYPLIISQTNPDYIVIQQACPDFVPLLEAAEIDMNSLQRAAAHYLSPLIKAQVDTLILGCTHYAFLHDLLQEKVGNSIQLVSAFSCIKNNSTSFSFPSFLKVDFFVTGPLPIFKITSKRVLDSSIIIESTYKAL